MSAIRRLAGVVIACLLGMSAGAFAQLDGDWRLGTGLEIRINGSEARFTAFSPNWENVHAAGNINLGDLNMRNLTRISTYVWEGQSLWYWNDIWTTFWTTNSRVTLSADGNSFVRYDRAPNGQESTQTFTRSRNLDGDWRHSSGTELRINGSECRLTAFNRTWANVHAAGNINLGDLYMRDLTRISTYVWEGQSLWIWPDTLTTIWSAYDRITLSQDGNSFTLFSRAHTGREATSTFYRSWDDGFVQMGGSWRYLNWFGSYSPLTQGWIWHKHLGYLYMSPSSRSSGMYMYDRNQGWLFTRRTLYPYLLRFSDQTWLWYSKNTSNPRWFRNLRTGQWESR